MRASLIALIALVASPLMVFAAPSSQIGSLAERDAVPPGGGLSDNVGALNVDEIIERLRSLDNDDAAAEKFIGKLSSSQLKDLVDTMNVPERGMFLHRFQSIEKVVDVISQLG